MLTADHCLAGDTDAVRSLEAYSLVHPPSCNAREIPFSSRPKLRGGRIAAQNPQRDWVLIEFDQSAASIGAATADYNPEAITREESAVTIGHPLTSNAKIAFGVITAVQELFQNPWELRWVASRGRTQHGSSGGPLFSVFNPTKIVGVASRYPTPVDSSVDTCRVLETLFFTKFSLIYPEIRSLLEDRAAPVPVINSFTAVPPSIRAGETSVLSWSVSGNGPEVFISDVGPVSANGTTRVAPAATTTYTLTARNSGGTVQSSAMVTVSPGPANTLAVMNSPAAGTTLPGACATFRWTAGTGASEYFLEAGPAEGSTQYASVSAGLDLSREICGLPTDGSSIFIRLWTKLPPEDWRSNDYQFQAANGGSPATLATLASPQPGSTLTGSCVTFGWSAGNGALEYYLDIGASEGTNQFAAVSTGLSLSHEVCGLPNDGSAAFVRLWTRVPGDDWRFNDYRFRAVTVSIQTSPAELESPRLGSVLMNTCATFTWTTGAGVTQYRLALGRFGSDLKLYYFYDENLAGRRAASVCSIPQVGGKVYVHVWSNPGGNWTRNEYVFSTGTAEMYFTNGDFESAPNPQPGSWVTLRSGEAFDRWIVGGHSIDIHDGRGNDFARSGRQSVDLSGEAAGSILQTMSTQPGQKYRITFWYAGHSYHPYAGDAMATVSWGHRALPHRQIMRITRPGSTSDQRLNWIAGQLDVVAEFGESFLTFTSNSPNGGIVLDDVKIQPID
jgi:hypothetical protein